MEAQEPTNTARRTASDPAIDKTPATVSAEAAKNKPAETESKANDSPDAGKKQKPKCAKKHAKHNKAKKIKKTNKRPGDEESDDSSDDESSGSSSSDTDNTDSESDSDHLKRHKKVAKKKAVGKSTKSSPTKKAKKTAKKADPILESDSSDSEAGNDIVTEDEERKNLAKQLQMFRMQQNANQLNSQFGQYPAAAAGLGYSGGFPNNAYTPVYGGNFNNGNLNNPITFHVPPPSMRRVSGRTQPILEPEFMTDDSRLREKQNKKLRIKQGTGSKLTYKRVDQVWDNHIHNYKLQDTTESSTDASYSDSLFHVRRTFDWEGKYKTTIVDVKSKLLRECLQAVVGNIKGVSLVEETPKLDPNMLFLYLEDLRKYMNKLEKDRSGTNERRERKKEKKRAREKRRHLKVLIKYLDKDYAEVKESLYPMLENGLITFDLLWALWKPNTLAYTSTYGQEDEPRVFKVEAAEKHFSIMKGDFYYIEGKYFEFDGKQFGYGRMSEEQPEFRGAQKITSLGCYPLQYHKNEAQLRKDLIERGKKFARLSGVHYKAHEGMAFMKKKKSIIKVNIDGRIMIDSAIHRRLNPNYPISLVRPKDHDIVSDNEGSDAESRCGDCASGSEANASGDEELEKVKYVRKVIKDAKGNKVIIRMPKFDDEEPPKEKLDKVPIKVSEDAIGDEQQSSTEVTETSEKQDATTEFSDEEYLIASPVVLGFAFAEKFWLEFTVSGVKEIQWNETAWDSLVLEPKTKDIVKALVKSHKYHAAQSIDDVIQGKGKGLVAVLHGRPGTGKTLTAEGISELLKCPLYMASAGELGIDSRHLEVELQKILDICHAWGAILLLDEADVFLEKRNMHDLNRNAMVSIFLRQLEYFQGILFLTTNRVETFDEAFQSRIHIALRYDELDQRAKKAIFKMFIELVRVMENVAVMPFSEEDYNLLAKHNLNGRQIKNTVRTAQALAVNKGEPLSMRHIREVMELAKKFEGDLKGGPGFEEAMRSYF